MDTELAEIMKNNRTHAGNNADNKKIKRPFACMGKGLLAKAETFEFSFKF